MKKNYSMTSQTKVSKIQKVFLVTFLLLIVTFKVNAQYCAPTYGSPCTSDDVITYFEIGTLNNSTGCSAGNYGDYTALPAPTLYLGLSYQAAISTVYGAAGVSIWIDFNDDFTFDPSERVGTTSTFIGANSTGSVTVSIPAAANSGTHRLRTRLIYNDLGTNADPCTSYGYGEAEDYLVNLIPLPPCTGSPVAGDAVSTTTLICANTAFDLNLVNNGINSGLTYQWQSSPNGSSWTNLSSVLADPSYSIASVSSTTYYQCVVTCTSSAQSSTSTPVMVTLNPMINCYCTISLANNNTVDCTQDKIVDFSIANVVSQTTNCDGFGYSDSTASNYTSINLSGGNTYTLTANTLLSGFNGDGMVGAWIDYNQNAIFDSNEYTCLGSGPSGTYLNTIMVPITVNAGVVRMRIMLNAYYTNASTVLNPCTNSSGALGQVLDYKVNLTAAPACSGAPNAGDAISTTGVACTTESFTLDLTNNSVASGISYQWQSSPNGTVWANMGSAQNSIPYFVTSQAATTYYRCVSTCTSAALTGTSNPVTVTKNDAYNCLCSPDNISCSSSQITNLVFENINHAPACSSGVGYTDYMSLATVSLTANQSYSIAIDINSQIGNGYVGLWIDYDQSGTFEPAEYTYVGNTSAGTLTTNIAVPYSAVGGLTGMRVKMESTFGSFAGLEPCIANESYGQTLDYLVDITAATPCAGTPNAGDATAPISSVCQNTPFTLDLINNDIVSGMTYQWQSSPDNVIWTNMGTSQSYVPYTVTTQTVNMHYRCLTTCIASSITSTSSMYVVNQNPTTACYCIPAPLDCSGNDAIHYVEFDTMTNPSGCGTNGYTDYTGSVASVTVNAGQSYTLTTVVGYMFGDQAYAWIDYDQNGIFDPSEYTSLGSASGNDTIKGVINIPGSVMTGTTRMRVREYSGPGLGSGDACNNPGGGLRMANPGQQVLGTGQYGETEDYAITILPPDCSTLNYPPSYNVTGSTDICPAGSTTLDISPSVQTATGITYEWFYFNGSSYVSAGPSATSQYTAAPSVNTPYYCEVQCHGSFARASDTVMVNIRTITTAPVTTSATCNGLCDGSATMNATSSGALLSYTWTPTVGTADMAVALCAGNYTVDIQNPTGCMVTETLTITSPSAIVPNPSSADVTCFGGNNGSITLLPSGGAGSYTYSWTPNVGTTSTVTNLTAGTYSYMIMDANSCNKTGVIIISEPSALTATTSHTDISCFGLNDGIAMVTPNGGTGPYTYAWSSSANVSDTEITLAAGTYTCTITDANLCTSTQTIAIVEPTALNATSTQTNANCFGLSTGSASVSVTGGTGAYTYSWSPSSSVTPVLTGINAGTYTCLIQDANLCVFNYTVAITEPGAIVATPSQTNVSCFGLNDGAATINVIGGTSPLSFSWAPTGGTSLSATNLTAGSYTFSIVDGNSCSVNQVITITQPGALSASVTGPSSICEQIPLGLVPTITGGAAPYSYSWTENPSSAVVSTDSICIYDGVVGSYSYYLSLTDGNNCTVNSNTLNITVNPSSNISGMVTTNTTVPVAGRVVLYKYLPFYTKFDSVAGQPIQASGAYNFVSFTSGIYIVKAIPTATNLQIAYGDTAVNWKTAKQIIHGCAVNDIQNIEVKPLAVLTGTGTGMLSGTIYEGQGFGQRMASGAKPAIPGTPIGGIIVKGGKNPGGQMFVQTITPTSGPLAGTYTLSGLPPNGPGESYFILVDIPGLDTNNTYHKIITLANNQFTGLDFVVDSAKINPIPSSVISVHDISAIENQIKVFPNPASSYVTIQYSLQTSSSVKIELFDMLGRSVKMLLPQTQQSNDMHKQSWQTNDLRSGLYFIKMTINGSESIIKLSVTD